MDILYLKQKASIGNYGKHFYVGYETTSDNFPPVGIQLSIGETPIGFIEGMEYDILNDTLKVYLEGKITKEENLLHYFELGFELV